MRQCRDKIFLRVSVPLWPEICAIIAPNTEEFAMALHPLQSRRDAPAGEACAATQGRRYGGLALSRRDFARAAFAAVLAARPVLAGRRSLEPLSPGIKISLQIPADFTDDDLTFARQIGVEYVSIPTAGGTYETFARFKARVEAAGLKVANIGNSNVHNMPEVTLNLPGRDSKIEEYKQYLPDLAGIPRSIFGNFDGYARALEIAASPNIGVCLCCGTWMEGGRQMGKDVFEAIRAFAKMGKLWKIHFRNVSAPVPYFVETFVDNGYTDMKRVMRTLVEVDFRGILIADHVPRMVGDRRTGWAYSIGYIRALYDTAREARRKG